MVDQLKSPLYLQYEPKSPHGKPIALRVTTVEGLDEVAELVKKRTGYIHFTCEDEFRQAIEAERITDDCTKLVGAVYAQDSVFYVYV